MINPLYIACQRYTTYFLHKLISTTNNQHDPFNDHDHHYEKSKCFLFLYFKDWLGGKRKKNDKMTENKMKSKGWCVIWSCVLFCDHHHLGAFICGVWWLLVLMCSLPPIPFSSLFFPSFSIFYSSIAAKEQKMFAVLRRPRPIFHVTISHPIQPRNPNQ